jgi:hypothetical protein
VSLLQLTRLVRFGQRYHVLCDVTVWFSSNLPWPTQVGQYSVYHSPMQLRCLYRHNLSTVPTQLCCSAAPVTSSLRFKAMSVPYSLGPEPEQPANMPSEPTVQLKQEQDSTTALSADSGGDETSEGAPETGMKLPPLHREGFDGAAGPAAFSGISDPQVGHDSKLPDKICPPGYSCNDSS